MSGVVVVNQIATNDDGEAKVTGTGTAGTPATGVVSVQGVSGGTALPVSDNGTTLSVDDGGSSITVDGTVAATQSGTWNVTNVSGTVSLPTGAATAANQTTMIGHLDGVEGFLTTIDADTSALAGTVQGFELQVDVVGALPAGTNNIGDVDVLTLPALPTGTNTIGNVRLTDGTDVADVLDLTNSNPLAVAIVDSSGDQISSFGGGTQYTEGDTDASVTGTAMLWEDTGDTLRTVSASKPLPVEILAGSSSGTEYTEGDTDATITGTAVLMEGAANALVPLQGTSTDGLLVNLGANNDVTVTGTVAATQSGTWNVTNVSGTVSLPTGASTSANQTTIIGHLDGVEGLLTTIDADTSTLAGAVSGSEMQVDIVGALPAGTNNIGDVDVLSVPAPLNVVGSGTEATALRVTLATDSTGVLSIDDNGSSITVDGTVAATQSGAWNITNISGTVSLPTGAATSANQSTIIGHLDGVEGLLTSIDGDTGTLAATVAGTEVQVDIVASLPAGTNNIGDVDIVSVPAPLSTTGGGTEAAALRVTIANDSTGVVSIDDNGASITVDGTVAATQSGTWNITNVSGTVSLPTGAATSANQSTIIGHLDGVEGLLTTIDGDTGALAGTVSGSEVQVDVVAALPTGDNTVGRVKLTDGTDVADILDLTNANPLTVAIVDGSGDQITSFGGGIQYTEGDTDATITGTAMLMEGAGNTLVPAQGTVADGLLVNLGSNNDVTVTGTVAATQSGTWNVTNVSGTVSLPTGAATSANQTTIIGHLDGVETVLGTIDADTSALAGTVSGTELQVDVVAALPAGDNNIGNVDIVTVPAPLSTAGGGTEATALRVTIATDSTGVLSIDDNGSSITVDNGGTFAVQATLQTGDNTVGRVKLTDGTDVADILDLTNSNPLTVAIVDGAGTQITSFGGGTQYTEGDTDATITGTAMLMEGAGNALVVAQGTAADGLLVNLGSNNDVTVTGSVTANAGTNLNTSALALESGGNLAGAATSLAILDDWDESDRAKVNPIVGQAGVQGGSGTVSATTQRVVLATDVALPAGTNAIGKLAANSGVDIGDVDVISLPNVTIGTMANLTESLVDDAAFTPAVSRVLPVGFTFDDASPDSVNEGDIGAARMSANRNLYTTLRDAAGNERGANVNASNQLSVSVDNTVTVASHAVTNAGTFAVQSTLQTGDNTVGRVKLTDGTDVADVLDLANSNPLTVAIVDASGDQITTFGGGTQYTQGDTDASITGTAMLMEVAADALQPVQGTVADGLLVNLGSNNDVTVTGSVTANAGTNLNTSALALESGGNLAGAAASLAILDDWDESDRAKVNPIVGQAGVQGGSGAVSATTQRVVLATDVALPTGSNAIGKLAANDGVDIGDVTINNASGASAVHIQDGGNSITVDAPTGTPVNVQIGDGTRQATVRDTGGSDSLNVSLVNDSGAQIGLSAAPLRIDPTGTTTQPITPVATTTSGSITGSSQTGASIDLNGRTTAAVQVEGTWTGVVSFQGTVDGTNWWQVPNSFDMNSWNSGGQTEDPGIFMIPVGGLKTLRVRSGGSWTGTATISVQTAESSSAISVASPLQTGQNTVGGMEISDSQSSTRMTMIVAGGHNALPVGVVDASGAHITSFGGGIQYTEGDTDATITGTAMLMEGAGNALVVAQGTAADGLLVNLGSNNDVTVTGSVTANAGTNLNTSALALESGGNLAGAATSLAILDDWDESDRAKVNPIVGQAGVQGGSGTVSNTTQRVVLATDVALPTGDNSIGRLKITDGTDVADVLDLANSNPLTVAIVDGSGTQITSFGGGTQYTEDVASAADPVGTMLMAVRADSLAAVTTTDGDNIAARSTNKGEVYVKHVDTIPVTDNAGSLTVDAPVGTPVNVQIGDGTRTATVRDTGSSDSLNVAIVDGSGNQITSFGGGTQYTEDVAAAADPVAAGLMLVRTDAPSPTTVTADGDNIAARANSRGAMYVEASVIAHDEGDAGNPVKIGGVARQTFPTAVADGDRVNGYFDDVGRQVAVVGQVRDLITHKHTQIVNSTTETTILTAVASHFLDLCQLILTNHSTTAVNVTIKDATAGTTRMIIALAANGGAVINFSRPVPQAAVNNNWTATLSVNTVTVSIFALGESNK